MCMGRCKAWEQLGYSQPSRFEDRATGAVEMYKSLTPKAEWLDRCQRDRYLKEHCQSGYTMES